MPADPNLRLPADAGRDIREHVALAPLTTLGVGGPARWYQYINSIDGIADAITWARQRGCDVLVLGGGSNVVISDEGCDAFVLHVGVDGVSFDQQGSDTLVVAGAGEPWDALVARTVDRGLSGLECLSGIPGSVGGTPVQNVGAYGQEVAQVIEAVDVLDTRGSTRRRLTAAECGFGYRMSRFKGGEAGRFVVLRVTFRLRPGSPRVAYPDLTRYLQEREIISPDVRDVRDAILAIRRRKGMVLDAVDPDTRSVGSFFMNPVVSRDVHAAISSRHERVPSFAVDDDRVKVPAAWLIEHAGVERGYAMGAAAVSTKHPLALVNRGGATAREIVALARYIKSRVAERFGVWLRPEPIFVGFGDDRDVTYLQDAHG